MIKNSLQTHQEFKRKNSRSQRKSHSGLKVVKESYFKQEGSESVDEVDSLLGEENVSEEAVSEAMAKYTQAITNFKK
jgi:nicotinamide mononucleotide adenylyltransferase